MSKKKSVCESKVFEELYSEHSKSIYNFAFYKCGNTAKSEDLVQEAFIKMWNNCAKIIFEKAKSYLLTVVNNLFLNQVAHQKVVLSYNLIGGKEATNETPEFLMEEKEFMDKLQKAISDLKEGQREVFLLSRIDKKTYKEIAEMLSISVKAVEKRMHMALKQLREKVGNI
ncbi:ECF RNA polymerase sigma factor SigE [Polaribacter huanghezhanensis]|uniref:RNA polymerase sigma factor n=1 Tax=Polaribacter huanghezhanensis TaxID=1354726 RepID=UPI002648EE64|nr:sigma-70 family RNA polymerase sigma factor [Polaribacter huanghezhanensis]WKD85515.1 ECF RNA polymerase sigma factor SigE [Polaribacter huanghezhanensis]